MELKIKNSHIQAVIFDLDDTLWPLIPLIHDAELALFDWLQNYAPTIAGQHTIASMREWRAQLIPTNPRFEYDLWALRHTMLTQLFLTADTDQTRATQQADAAMQVFARARNQVSLYADVLPGLTELGQHFQLGSISNGFADLSEIGLQRHFKVSLAAHQFGCAKPDPRIFLAACEALQVAPHQAVYVGDDVRLDVQGAQQAGLAAVWMNRAGKVTEHTAQFACADLMELNKWLRN
jgi:putative hydrolase of the HAD superfamily